MFIRMINANEVLPALHLVWEVYVSDVAPLQNPEAVAGFQQFIKYDSIMPRIQNREIVLFGAWEGSELCGVSGVDYRGNILLLYVRKQWQRKGIGRQLMQNMYQFCAQTLVVTRVMMKVFPSAVTAMLHLGMREVAPVQNLGPETFIPMEMMIAPGTMKPQKSRDRVIIIVVIVAVVCAAFIGLLAKMVYDEAKQAFSNPYTYNDVFPSDDYEDDDEEDDLFDEDADETSMTGIDGIPEYEEQNLSFKVKEDSYLYSPDDTKTTYVDFEIYYPQIEGLADPGIEEKVNEELKSCAMESIDRIYDNPNTEIKERVLGEEYPIIADYVQYKVTYLTEDYISVAFEDYSYEGSEYANYVGLRTKNINLKDGTVYEVKDIINLSDQFVKEWLDVMRNEADRDDLLSELDIDEMKKALSGEDTKEGTYLPVFFADEDGLEIGFSFHYAEGDENNSGYGWVTAPFAPDRLQEHQIENNYWELVK